jgi:hypothetical protein
MPRVALYQSEQDRRGGEHEGGDAEDGSHPEQRHHRGGEQRPRHLADLLGSQHQGVSSSQERFVFENDGTVESEAG